MITDKLKKLMHSKKGEAAVEFLGIMALLLLLFSVFVMTMIYIFQYYSATYMCRRAVRSIEVAGKYVVADIDRIADEHGGDALDDLNISVNATYFDVAEKKIQLQDEFTVKVEAAYKVKVAQFGSTPIQLNLPIKISMKGRSEVYWK